MLQISPVEAPLAQIPALGIPTAPSESVDRIQEKKIEIVLQVAVTLEKWLNRWACYFV